MISGTFTVTVDELDELVEAIAVRTAGRIAAMFGHDPDGPPARQARPTRPDPTRAVRQTRPMPRDDE